MLDTKTLERIYPDMRFIDGNSRGDFSERCLYMAEKYFYALYADRLNGIAIGAYFEDEADITFHAVLKGGSIPDTDSFISNHSGWETADRIENFLKDKLKAKCFINKDQERVAIYFTVYPTQDFTEQKVALAVTALMPVISGIFGVENADEAEIEFFKGILDGKGSSDKLFDRLCESKKIFQKGIEIFLSDFERREYDWRLDEVNMNLTRNFNEIALYENYIQEAYRKIRELEITKIGLTTKAENTETGAIREYLAANKNIVVENWNEEGNSLYVTCFVTMCDFDVDQAESVINNPSFGKYFSRGGGMTAEDVQYIAKRIFIDQDAKVRMYAPFVITPSYVDGRNAVRTTLSEGDTRIPNPHIFHHRCTGGNKRIFEDALYKGDWISVFNQLMYSAGNFNFNDSVVYPEFMKDLFSTYYKHPFIELEDGRIVSPLELAHIGRAERKEENENE